MGVLIIEAGYRSGTSVTARLATIQKKKVFAIPHEIWDIHGVGTNRLIKEGAILVTCTNDILKEFDCFSSINFDDEVAPYREDAFIKNNSSLSNLKLASALELELMLGLDSKLNSGLNSNLNPSLNSSLNSKYPNNNNFSSKYEYVYKFISDTPISINELCKKTNKTINIILNDLFMLEMDGFIRKVAGGYICTRNTQ